MDSHALLKNIERGPFTQFLPMAATCVKIIVITALTLALTQSTTWRSFHRFYMRSFVFKAFWYQTVFFKCPNVANYLEDSILIPSIKKLSFIDTFYKINLTFPTW